MDFKIVEAVPHAAELGGDQAAIVCPWLAGLPAESGLWLSALPIHDVNSFVQSDTHIDVPPGIRNRTYFGLFALDRFRPAAQLIAALKANGIERIINLPSVSF